MVGIAVLFSQSAFNHGCTETDIRHALLHPVYNESQDDNPGKRFLLGFDRSLNLLEIVYNIIDGQTVKVFHAMKCQRRHYAKLKQE